MSRLENVISQVKDFRNNSTAWIFDDNGNISEDVICGDILPVLEELKDYEINVSDEWINNFRVKAYRKGKGYNTYNDNANISNDINIDYLYTKNNECILLIMVHLVGDIRAGYSDYFAVKFECIEEFFSLECFYQYIDINDKYCADINLLSEMYTVYDIVNGIEIGEFYEIEKADLLESIKERIAS